MNCERCGQPYMYIGSWDAPPENHYWHCYRCNRYYYPYGPSEEEN